MRFGWKMILKMFLLPNYDRKILVLDINDMEILENEDIMNDLI